MRSRCVPCAIFLTHQVTGKPNAHHKQAGRQASKRAARREIDTYELWRSSALLMLLLLACKSMIDIDKLHISVLGRRFALSGQCVLVLSGQHYTWPGGLWQQRRASNSSRDEKIISSFLYWCWCLPSEGFFFSFQYFICRRERGSEREK